MKPTIEQELLGVRDKTHANEAFVQSTMEAIREQNTQQAFKKAIGNNRARRANRLNLLQRLRQLPATILIILAVLFTVSLGGGVYAAVRYLPALVRITHTSTITHDTKQYWVPAFSQCSSQGTQRFDVSQSAQLSENAVQRLIEARCETDTIDKFVSQIWPTYGTHKVWKSGDIIYYAQADVIGSLQSVSASSVTVNESSSGTSSNTFHVVPNTELTAYADGVKVPLHSLNKNSTVFVIMRVSQKYVRPNSNQEFIINPTPSEIGVIGLIKLSQPLKYYGSMQNDLTELPPCLNNPGEFCPSTAQIDVFPAGSEGAQNPDLSQPSSNQTKIISGQVTQLGASTLTLKATSGKDYTVATPTNALAAYNGTYAPIHGNTATLQIGSWVQVIYSQSPHTNSQTVTANQIQQIALLITGDIKDGQVTQYQP